MTENQKALAYYKALLADALSRDKAFPKEGNVQTLRYNMRLAFVYGGGPRE